MTRVVFGLLTYLVLIALAFARGWSVAGAAPAAAALAGVIGAGRESLQLATDSGDYSLSRAIAPLGGALAGALATMIGAAA